MPKVKPEKITKAQARADVWEEKKCYPIHLIHFVSPFETECQCGDLKNLIEGSKEYILVASEKRKKKK